MPVDTIHIESRTSYRVSGVEQDFELIRGIFQYVIDPKSGDNANIVGLNDAETGDGLVRSASDFVILKPKKTSSSTLLVHIPNRGRLVVPFSNAPFPATPSIHPDPGDLFLLAKGWMIAWIGWQWDVIRRPGLLGFMAPLAKEFSLEPVCLRFQTTYRRKRERLAHWPLHPSQNRQSLRHKALLPLDPKDPSARLTLRANLTGSAIEIPRAFWRFVHSKGNKCEYVELDGGFQPGGIYELTYCSSVREVAGAGLLAIRDAVSFLRYTDYRAGNPLSCQVENVIGWGESQCGRLLREFLHMGLNTDEMGRPVFDGILVHSAGARLGDFNRVGAQPSANEGWFPFSRWPHSSVDQPNPLNGKMGSLLTSLRARKNECLPKLIQTNTSAEYWRSEAFRLHISNHGSDLEPLESERIYHFAGTQHAPGTASLHSSAAYGEPLFGAVAANHMNWVDHTPLLRCAICNLHKWVTGVSPPPQSNHPRLMDGTAVDAREVLTKYIELVGLTKLAIPELSAVGTANIMEDRYDTECVKLEKILVSDIDAHGNEIAGIRLPDISVPVATNTGWNTRLEETGCAGHLVPFIGTTLPFLSSAKRAILAGDRRGSMEGLYGDRNEFKGKVKNATDNLIDQGFVVARDRQKIIDSCMVRYALAMR